VIKRRRNKKEKEFYQFQPSATTTNKSSRDENDSFSDNLHTSHSFRFASSSLFLFLFCVEELFITICRRKDFFGVGRDDEVACEFPVIYFQALQPRKENLVNLTLSDEFRCKSEEEEFRGIPLPIISLIMHKLMKNSRGGDDLKEVFCFCR
jgi:hypothetical protein